MTVINEQQVMSAGHCSDSSEQHSLEPSHSAFVMLRGFKGEGEGTGRGRFIVHCCATLFDVALAAPPPYGCLVVQTPPPPPPRREPSKLLWRIGATPLGLLESQHVLNFQHSMS